MANKTIFESTNMLSTTGGAHIIDAVADVELENGTIGYVNDVPEEGVTYKFTAGTTAGKNPVIVDDVPIDYDNVSISAQRRENYSIKAGKKFRVREIVPEDRFAVSIDGFTTATQETVKGYDGTKTIYVTADASTGKLVASETATTDATYGVIVGKRSFTTPIVNSGTTYSGVSVLYKIRIIKVVA